VAGAANKDAAFFKAKEASVVNGAQTVSTLGRALSAGMAADLERAYVSVRCIELGSDAPDLARRVTRYANTQNVVSSQDFVFLDEEQHRLTKELRLLGYEYLLRSGEVPTSRDPNRIIDVRQAEPLRESWRPSNFPWGGSHPGREVLANSACVRRIEGALLPAPPAWGMPMRIRQR
jgi:hypothetical protein